MIDMVRFGHMTLTCKEPICLIFGYLSKLCTVYGVVWNVPVVLLSLY